MFVAIASAFVFLPTIALCQVGQRQPPRETVHLYAITDEKWPYGHQLNLNSQSFMQATLDLDEIQADGSRIYSGATYPLFGPKLGEKHITIYISDDFVQILIKVYVTESEYIYFREQGQVGWKSSAYNGQDRFISFSPHNYKSLGEDITAHNQSYLKVTQFPYFHDVNVVKSEYYDGKNGVWSQIPEGPAFPRIILIQDYRQ